MGRWPCSSGGMFRLTDVAGDSARRTNCRFLSSTFVQIGIERTTRIGRQRGKLNADCLATLPLEMSGAVSAIWCSERGRVLLHPTIWSSEGATRSKWRRHVTPVRRRRSMVRARFRRSDASQLASRRTTCNGLVASGRASKTLASEPGRIMHNQIHQVPVLNN